MNAELIDFRFPPESTLWKVNAPRGTTLWGGQRALHGQIAHPLVAQALYDSKTIILTPGKRLKATLDAGLDMSFGTLEEAAAVAEAINIIHEYVHGKLIEDTGIYKADTPYNAMDQDLLKWVGATLIDGSIYGYEKSIGDLTLAEKDDYLANAKDLFTMVHLEPNMLPDRFEGLQEYMQDMIDTERVKVGPLALELAPHLTLSHTRLGKISMGWLRGIAAYSLQDELREQFGYSLPTWERTVLDLAAASTKNRLVKVMPDFIRLWEQPRRAKRLLRAA